MLSREGSRRFVRWLEYILKFGTSLARRLNQSRVSAMLLLSLIAIYFGTAEARRLNWASVSVTSRRRGSLMVYTLNSRVRVRALAGALRWFLDKRLCSHSASLHPGVLVASSETQGFKGGGGDAFKISLELSTRITKTVEISTPGGRYSPKKIG